MQINELDCYSRALSHAAYFQTLSDQAAEFRRAQASLRDRKEKEFPYSCAVYVKSSRYRGYGIVVRYDEPADRLSVLLENGNVWQYPIEDCRRVPWKQADQPSRRSYLRHRGYKFPGMHGPWSALP